MKIMIGQIYENGTKVVKLQKEEDNNKLLAVVFEKSDSKLKFSHVENLQSDESAIDFLNGYHCIPTNKKLVLS